MDKERRSLSLWFQASRPFSFTASITPVLIAAAFVLSANQTVKWYLLPIFLLCAVLIHAATNLISDYVDFKKGIDRAYTFGSSGVLVSKLLSPKQVRCGAYILFLIALVFGLFIVRERGLGLLWLGLLGIAAGYFYTVGPVGYKYHALGDLFVFLFMGVLLVVGAYWTLTASITINSILISLPISFLVAAILFANNTRDIKHDREACVHTLAGRLGFERAKKFYYLLLVCAYLTAIVLVVSKVVTPWGFIVFLSLPKAYRNIAVMKAGVEAKPQTIATLDVQTAQLHLVFGVLFVIALVLQAWVK